MESIKQEILELREEVITLKAGMEHLTALVEALVAAQVNPPMMEERIAKVFLETLNSSFPKGIVVRTPTVSHGEVDMKAFLEKDVRKECLLEEGNSAGSVKKFGNDFSKKRIREETIIINISMFLMSFLYPTRFMQFQIISRVLVNKILHRTSKINLKRGIL